MKCIKNEILSRNTSFEMVLREIRKQILDIEKVENAKKGKCRSRWEKSFAPIFKGNVEKSKNYFCVKSRKNTSLKSKKSEVSLNRFVI